MGLIGKIARLLRRRETIADGRVIRLTAHEAKNLKSGSIFREAAILYPTAVCYSPRTL